jgi:pSer/pThr/pTyr-binding forkhead associated (FHA) protein
VADLTLEIVEGPGVGRRVPLTGALEVGRDAQAGFRVADEHVDALHVRVTPAGDGALVEDLGERGGTFVNGAEIHVPTRIRLGDEIQLGVTVIELRGAGEPSAARTAPAAPQVDVTHEVESLLDVRTKTKARHAPLAVFVVVVYAVLLYLATQRL